MQGTAIWESNEVDMINPANENQAHDLKNSRRRITALKRLTLELVREVQSIGEVKVLDLDSGLDFYNEVTTFEIDLISRALLLTGGHQARAAKLLNLKGTTLNSKIKSYKIRPESFAGTSASWNTRNDEIAAMSLASEQNQERLTQNPERSFA